MSSSTVYEDNNRAIVVATSPSMTPTSKHIAVKYHWFRQHVGKEFVIHVGVILGIFANCPLLWVSKLQTEIALSTIHSEYVALSHSVRALLPLESLIKEVIDNLGIDIENLKFVSSSTIYEDNNGPMVVAKIPRMTSTSKRIAVKYYWFRQHVGK